MKNKQVLLSILLLVGSLFVPILEILNVKFALAYVETEIGGKKVRKFTGDKITKNIGSDKASKVYGSAFWLTIGSILSLLLGFKTMKNKLQMLAAIMLACVIGLLGYFKKLANEEMPEGTKINYTNYGLIYYGVLIVMILLPVFKHFRQSKTK